MKSTTDTSGKGAMKTVPVINRQGEKVGEVQIAEQLLAIRVNPQLMRDVIVGYRRNQRQGTASTLTKGEVRGSGIKPWKQKGTGRARAGMRRSPLWRGGGVTFGPKPRDFERRIPQGMRRKALAAAFADKVRGGEVRVVDRIEAPGGKTRELAGWFKKIDAARKPLVVLGARNAEVERAARNIPGAGVVQRGSLSAWLLMAHGAVVIAQEDFKTMQEQLS
ncbi:MAG: 50S ribosomal protein L4 [Candidatus Aureabacteria bacterium]|nr:50S ribosomal protein L4 [Candidatus Auribacterota bacterium]